MAKIPAYRTMYTELKQRIQNGTYPADNFLPTEPELEKMFDVSRTTVRKAVGILIAEGYLKATQGKGTVVLNPSASQTLNYISSITETLKARGYRVSVPKMHIEQLCADEALANAMHISPQSPVYRVERVLNANGTPIAYMLNYLRANFVPDLEAYENAFVGLYEFLETHYHLILTDAVETLTATTADFLQAALLQTEVGAPLICSKRLTNTDRGVLEYAQMLIRADRYEYTIHLARRQ